MQKVSKKTPKMPAPFAPKILQNHKNPSLGLKMCPKPPKGVPRHPKYSKIIKKRAPGPPKSLKITRIWQPEIKKILEKQTSRIQEIKMRHGGGLCAQRPG